MTESDPPSDLVRFLVDLEQPFSAATMRAYDPVALVRFALAGSTYWAELALGWLESGVPAEVAVEELRSFENDRHRPQVHRHRARQLRKAVES